MPTTASQTAEQTIETLISEGPIGMAAAARLMGTFRGGKPTHPSTLTRHCLAGVKLQTGEVVRLEHFRAANRLMTTRPALLRFLAAQQVQPTAPPVVRSPAARNRASARSALELKKFGK